MPDQQDTLVVRRQRPAPGIAIVTAVGEIDLLTAPRLHRALARVREPTILLDLTGVTFLAAAGLTVLVAANAEALSAGRRFGVVGAAGMARRTLEVSGVAELVPSYASMAEADAG
ncbi:MAG TPA: STAS domain-containing protein [Actinophytocola sp.]|jgi:anti-anti-sigma factor|uniref:STAS domain-containing protein n=1 Tax=Actinophytocola sp. TaxID=1872138 RepID=UPI002F92A9AA